MYCARRPNDALQHSAGGYGPTDVLDVTCYCYDSAEEFTVS